MSANIEHLYQQNIEDLSPFAVWEKYANETQLLKDILRENLSCLKLNKDKKLKILDVGCSTGNASLELISILNFYQFDFFYSGLDPFPEQLAVFKKRAQEMEISNVEFLPANFTDFCTEQIYDLVFVSHSFYYFPEPRVALEKLLNLAKNLIIVQQGENGINHIHQAFSTEIDSPNQINLTAQQLIKLFNSLEKNDDFTLTVKELNTIVDVSACQNPDSPVGKKLLSFFLEKNYADFPDQTKAKLHYFFQKKYPEVMENNTGILFISKR